jgi:hypothetical protein
MTGRTLKDLEVAENRLERAHDALARSSTPHTNAHQTSMSEAAAEVRAIERDLKQAGILPRSDHEVLESKLDAAYPDAAASDIVRHEGRRYTRRFFPVRKTSRGKVLEWGRSWVEVLTPP